MSRQVNPEGRVDRLAHGILKRLAASHPNPIIKLGMKAFEPEIAECLNDELGPHTDLGKIGKRLVRALESDK